MSRSTISTVLRRAVLAQFKHQCAYCRTQQKYTGTSLTVDHIVPVALDGETIVENLCAACWDCNLAKNARLIGVDPISGKNARLFHPQNQRWQDHFKWLEQGLLLEGKTQEGRATVVALRLNRPTLLQARKYWIVCNWHPPVD